MLDQFAPNEVELAADITAAWLGGQRGNISAAEVGEFLRAMHATLSELGGTAPKEPEAEAPQPAETFEPAVTVRKSLSSKDHIISLIDGRPYRTLRRHLSRHGLTPEQYRERYNLKADYPMVAESYSEQRREMAKKIGLGSKGRGGGRSKGSGSAT